MQKKKQHLAALDIHFIETLPIVISAGKSMPNELASILWLFLGRNVNLWLNPMAQAALEEKGSPSLC